jgi:hypothetical protein
LVQSTVFTVHFASLSSASKRPDIFEALLEHPASLSRSAQKSAERLSGSSPSRSAIRTPITHERTVCPSGWPSTRSSAKESAERT